MALTDPQSFTIGTVPGAVSVNRVYTGSDQGKFQNADQSVVYKVGSTYGNRIRRTARLEYSKIAADPITSVNSRKGATVIITIDQPQDGFSVTELKDLYLALTNNLEASTNAMLLALLGGQN